jgi:tyrosinase
MEILTPADFANERNPLSTVNRRVFIKGIGFVSSALLMGVLGGCEPIIDAIENRPIRRRLRTGSPEVDADIATYKAAVTAMKALPGSDPTSWTAQAAIHGNSSGFTFCEHGTDHFFDWHRGYLFHFEKICQKLTGNSKFGLPYWNWNQNPDIHPEFLDATGPLFLARTRTSMTGSGSVTDAALDPIFADNNFFTFRPQLEGTPHNNVHTFIGGTMGGGASPLDPVFWTHHCMVDYCWYKWNVELENDNPNDPAWVNHDNTHFVDKDGNAASVTAGVTTLMPLLSYQYESSIIGSSPMMSLLTKADLEKVEKRIRQGADIKFDVKQRVRVADKVAVSVNRPFSAQTRVAPQDIARILNSDATMERVFASIQYAELPANSDFTVRVFLNMPTANSTTPISDPHYAGAFTFFGTKSSSPGEHNHAPQFLVHLTNTIQRLQSQQALKAGAPLSLQLVPVPFAGKFERADVQLALAGIEIITTPVIIKSGPR